MTYATDDISLLPAPERTTGVHVLMPSMAFACGRSILDGEHNGFQVGINDWAGITCVDCRAFGEDELRDEMRRQQGNQA